MEQFTPESSLQFWTSLLVASRFKTASFSILGCNLANSPCWRSWRRFKCCIANLTDAFPSFVSGLFNGILGWYLSFPFETTYCQCFRRFWRTQCRCKKHNKFMGWPEKPKGKTSDNLTFDLKNLQILHNLHISQPIDSYTSQKITVSETNSCTQRWRGQVPS